MPNVRGLSDADKQARIDALRQKYRSEAAYDDINQQIGAPVQFLKDVARNAAGLPEVAGTALSGMFAQAGSGLGTTAGVVADTLRNGIGGGVDSRGNPYLRIKKPDMDAAAEVVTENTERFTAAPRTEGGEQALQGLGTVLEPLDTALQEGGQKVSEATGSPALGALTYAAGQFIDPIEHGVPLAAALKGSKALTGLIEAAGPSRGIASTGRRARQSGAWVPGDIAETPGDFQMRSPTVEAFTRLKPQEQKNLSGKQLMKALTREGAKKEELQWMGLDKVLDTDEVMSVADVKRLAEANQPKIEHAQARSGGGTELDDDAVTEAAHNAVSEDDDRQYPVIITHREPGSRRYETYDAAPGSFDTADEADQWLDEHKADWIKQQTEHYKENIGDYISDEEELAGMDDDAREAWAQSTAESDVDELLGSFSTENDYDAEPHNYQDLFDYHEQRIRDNPEDYGLEGSASGAPDYGEYTVGQYGSQPEANYTVATGKLAGESRFGRNMDEPSFMSPYQRAEQASAVAAADPTLGPPTEALANELRESQAQMQLLPPDAATQSKAYQREALRRGQIAEDPNRSKYTQQSSLSHYRDMGKNQMYFTRETSRPAPDWGTVKKGVGRVDETGLATAEGGELPPSGDENPLAFLEEAQSDWYQKGRKTGWADPEDLADVEKQRVDRTAQVEAFKQQAVGELNNLWTNPHVVPVIQRVLKDDGPDGYLGILLKEWEAMQPGGALTQSFSPAELQDRRIRTGKSILGELGNYADEYPQAGPLIAQTDQGLRMMTDMSEIPGAEDLTPTGPMRETPQYTQLAMADALRRAVQEGKQYFAWTPGDVHAHRWGSESMQYAPTAENPRSFRARFGGGRQMNEQPGTVLEKFQERADELLGDTDNGREHTFNLDDPEIDKRLLEAVESNLDYGMSDYPDPRAQRAKRAAGIKKDMEKLAAEAAAGNRRATHNSPRAYGYEQAYGPMEKHIINILRRSGVKPPEIRDIPMRGGDRGSELPMRGFEIDPDLARAAKRGFILPY